MCTYVCILIYMYIHISLFSKYGFLHESAVGTFAVFKWPAGELGTGNFICDDLGHKGLAYNMRLGFLRSGLEPSSKAPLLSCESFSGASSA